MATCLLAGEVAVLQEVAGLAGDGAQRKQAHQLGQRRGRRRRQHALQGKAPALMHPSCITTASESLGLYLCCFPASATPLQITVTAGKGKEHLNSSNIHEHMYTTEHCPPTESRGAPRRPGAARCPQRCGAARAGSARAPGG